MCKEESAVFNNQNNRKR